MIDDGQPSSASRVASGIINPVTGRRYVTTWMIDEIMPFALLCYEEMGKTLGIDVVARKNIIDFFPSVQMREAFIDRLENDNTYLQSFPDQNHFNQYFNYDFGCGEISPCYAINLQLLMESWQKKLKELNDPNFIIGNETFHHEELKVHEDGIQYKNIKAKKIIFCNGTGTINYPWFQLLPFAPNKGEAMIIECKGMNNQFIFKRSLSLVPLAEKDLFWLGSNYAWEFEHDQPTEQFHKQARSLLDKWLKLPYKIVEHRASVRPATLERRPFVGFHPQFPSIGILNGMGSKGTSLAPFFANQLVQHMVHGLPITPEANVNRFARILSK